MTVEIKSDESIVDGLRFAESIRNLDPNSGLKIALALAGTNPQLFTKLAEITKKQNMSRPSTLQLSPPPASPNGNVE
jgi:hypothetical protein